MEETMGEIVREQQEPPVTNPKRKKVFSNNLPICERSLIVELCLNCALQLRTNYIRYYADGSCSFVVYLCPHCSTGL